MQGFGLILPDIPKKDVSNREAQFRDLDLILNGDIVLEEDDEQPSPGFHAGKMLATEDLIDELIQNPGHL